jgi:eukaryotic-like serine/threonine-protein kinase
MKDNRNNIVLLDSGPLSWVTNKNTDNPDVMRCRVWFKSMLKRHIILIAEINDYEVRRELIHRKLNVSLERLDELITSEHVVVNAQGQTVLTMAIGTPGFMAPEQLNGKPEFASDIYALGVTAIYLLTRQILSNSQVDSSILKGVQIQHYLVKILENMVRYKCEERYHTVVDVLADLEPLTLLGQVLNYRYEIKSYLGGGGLSYTYLVQDKQRPYQANCIIKQLKLTSYNQKLFQEAQNRFVTGVQSLRKLPTHQQIPQLSDHFQNNKELYLVSDFIEGESFSRNIIDGSRLSEAEVIVLLKDVLELLTFIHQHGVIHGDIKPSNLIKRQQDGKFCLIDFAEFKQIVNLRMNAGSIFVAPHGTNGYMAPEQYQNQLQNSSDIYALGITAIQALTGVSPEKLQRDSQNEVIWRNLAKVSPKLARILDKMVRFQTGKRYQSAQKVLDDLNAQTLREKIEKYWVIYILVFAFFGISIGSIVYKFTQETKIDETFNEGITKRDEGEKLKKQGDIDGAKAKYLQAIEKFEEVIKLAPDHATARAEKGYLHGLRGEFIEQGHSCIEAIRFNPKNYKAHLCVGNAQIAAKQFGDSTKSFDKATKSCNSQSEEKRDKEEEEKTCISAWFNIGEAYSKLNEPEKARDAYNEALKYNPNFPEAKNRKIEAEKLIK